MNSARSWALDDDDTNNFSYDNDLKECITFLHRILVMSLERKLPLEITANNLRPKECVSIEKYSTFKCLFFLFVSLQRKSNTIKCTVFAKIYPDSRYPKVYFLFENILGNLFNCF